MIALGIRIVGDSSTDFDHTSCLRRDGSEQEEEEGSRHEQQDTTTT